MPKVVNDDVRKRKYSPHNVKFKPITKYDGMKFNKLTIIRDSGQWYGKQGNRKHMMICKCDCGNEIEAELYHILSGHTKSCGCYALRSGDKSIKCVDHIHYSRAQEIIRRTSNPNASNYHNYGGRDITHDLGDTPYDMCLVLDKVPGYFEGAQLDRIDNNGNYTIHHPIFKDEIWNYHDQVDGKDYQCLGNLRWVDRSTNLLNARRTITIDSLATVPRQHKDIIKMLKIRGWSYKDFDFHFKVGKFKSEKGNRIMEVAIPKQTSELYKLLSSTTIEKLDAIKSEHRKIAENRRLVLSEASRVEPKSVTGLTC